MRNSVRSALLAVATAVVLPMVAGAQAFEAPRPVSFGLAAGVSLPVGDISDLLDPGFNIQGSLAFQPAVIPAGMRAELTFQQLADKEGGHFRQFAGTVNGMFGLPLPLSPYFIGGVGIYNNRFTEEDEHHDHGHDHEHEHDDVHGDAVVTRAGINGGLGLRLGMGARAMTLEARLHHVFTDGQTRQIIPISVGFTF